MLLFTFHEAWFDFQNNTISQMQGVFNENFLLIYDYYYNCKKVRVWYLKNHDLAQDTWSTCSSSKRKGG